MGELGRQRTTGSIYLNDWAYWRNVPANLWSYKLGGYQVLKKWLSYRERKVLGRCSTSPRWGGGFQGFSGWWVSQ